MTTKIEDDVLVDVCIHLDHRPPMLIVIPSGKRLVHKCDGCGMVTVIYPIDCVSEVSMRAHNIQQDSLRSTIINAALSFELNTDWRSILKIATYKRPHGRELRFLNDTIELTNKEFNNVIDIMIETYK